MADPNEGIHPALMQYLQAGILQPGPQYDAESEAEANDFSIPDNELEEDLWQSRYEMREMTEEYYEPSADAARSADDQRTADDQADSGRAPQEAVEATSHPAEPS